VREIVHPGNQDYVRGDRIERPKGGGGGGSGKGQASDQGEGEDDFVFALSKEEFMQVFFEDLALPHLVRTQLAEVPEWKSHRAGFSSDGTPNNLHVVRSMRGALGRRIALGAGPRRELVELEAELAAEGAALSAGDPAGRSRGCRTGRAGARCARASNASPTWTPSTCATAAASRYPVPTSKAVMFCLMDVSGSMDEGRKELSKRFFILLYLFLTRHYEKIDLVFIRHHTQAAEVDEENFFHARETGGTVVSSALVLMEEIIRARYSPEPSGTSTAPRPATATTGTTTAAAAASCWPRSCCRWCRYFAYVQVAEEEQNLWEEYTHIGEVAPPLRDAQGHRGRADLPGVPRPLQEGALRKQRNMAKRRRSP
jgi:uncharacterized sporulation protein YeaH/YhbH (DUF444 family)